MAVTRIVAAHGGRELAALVAASTIFNGVKIMNADAQRTGVTTPAIVDYLVSLLSRGALNEQEHRGAAALAVWLAYKAPDCRLRPENAASDLANAVIECRISDDARSVVVQLHTCPPGATRH